MQTLGFFCLVAAMLATLAAGAVAAWAALAAPGDDSRAASLRWAERGHGAALALIVLASVVLLRALVGRDFSFQYVASYTDQYLPLFYAVTAFWAGQAGSFLFWALCVAVMGWVFLATPAYRRLSPRAKALFWLMHCAVQVFFLLVLTGPTNPFLILSPAPADGNGLNPLLRNPGMVFHPPLLFIGYAGFTVPACLALAAWLDGDAEGWLTGARNWALVSWAFLTAGIVLGAWWAYMELGWGGYWAWDPVENASLLPWLGATAFLHTAVIQARRGSLQRSNVFLAGFTLLLCFFATYVVRSGVIDSLHAFGDGGVGGVLLVFQLALGALCVGVPLLASNAGARPLDEFLSRPGFLVAAAWLLLATALVIFLGTMWPVISHLWSPSPVGLDAGFYNRVCLPLFTAMAVFLVFCPWMGWKGGVRDKRLFIAVGVSLLPAGMFFYAVGVRMALPLIAASAAVSCLAGIAALFATQAHMRASRFSWGAYGVHVGVALMVLGVAFSGPYAQSVEVHLDKGASASLKGYEFTYTGGEESSSEAMAKFQAVVEVSREGRAVGTLRPERRVYRNFERQAFSEVSVIPGLGDELYSTVLAHDQSGAATFKLAVNPLVNWVWIGGTLMSLLPFIALGRRR